MSNKQIVLRRVIEVPWKGEIHFSWFTRRRKRLVMPMLWEAERRKHRGEKEKRNKSYCRLRYRHCTLYNRDTPPPPSPRTSHYQDMIYDCSSGSHWSNRVKRISTSLYRSTYTHTHTLMYITFLCKPIRGILYTKEKLLIVSEKSIIDRLLDFDWRDDWWR